MLVALGLWSVQWKNPPSNFSKGSDLPCVLSREDPTEVCTLSGWVCPLVQPYPPYYWAAFAFSVISYPLLRPPSLRSGYHVCGEHRAYPVVDEEEYVRPGWSLYPGERIGCCHPYCVEVVLLTYHCGCGLSASLATCHSRGFKMTLHLHSTLPVFPSPPPRRGWQRSEHCPQSFAPRITRQHVWVGTPEHRRARSGSWSPSAVLLHRPYEVSQEYACSPPGHSAMNGGASRDSHPWHVIPGQWSTLLTAF